jgi:hypothetical protein
MVKRITALMLISVAAAVGAEKFEYSVFRDHIPRKEAGRLEISNTGVRYRSEQQKTAIDIPLSRVYKADVSDPKVIRIEIYDVAARRLLGRQVHVFRLRDGEHDNRLARFLSGAIQRPVVGSFGLESKPDVEIPAYHRHRFGGCHGTIRIEAGGISFQSDRAEDSRTWRYRDIETVGTMNAFHFRVTTLAGTFNFDLKERLPQPVYDLVSRRTYDLSPIKAPD